MKLVVFGLTITSSWGNGHATTYRSLLRALEARGHQILFIEKDVEWYRSNRDLPRPAFCTVHLYSDWQVEETKMLRLTIDADAVIIGSYFPDSIPATRALLGSLTCPLLFYDIDTPITLAALRSQGQTEYLEAALIPQFDAYLSFTGGPALRELESHFGARRALPFYCSVDPDLYHPVAIRPDLGCDLSYLGTYAPDRQPKLLDLLDLPARRLPTRDFLVAGPMYPPETLFAANVRHLQHLPPADHPAFYSSCRFTLNLTRADMVAAGYSPSVRLFEASACAAAILSDPWPGLHDFLTPGEEILIPTGSQGIVQILTGMSDAERIRLGRRARDRILAEHTAAHRARQFEQILSDCSDGYQTS